MKATRLVGMIAALLFAMGVSPSRAGFINGSFENGSYTFGSDGGDSLAPGSTTITGWTTFGAELTAIENANTLGLSTPFGNIFLDLTGYHDSAPYGGVQQSVSTVIGQTYDLTLYLGVNNSNPEAFGPVSVQVSAGSASTTLTADPTGSGMIWTPETWAFTANSTTTLVSIQGLSTASGDFIGLDNLSLVGPTSVPEPASITMLAAGATGALSYLRRRRVWGKRGT